MPGIAPLLWAAPCAAVAAAAAMALAWCASRRAGVAWSAGVVAGLAAGAVATSAHANGLADAALRLFRPTEAHHRVPLVALAAVAPALVAVGVGRRWPFWAIAAPLAGLAPLWLLWGGRYLPPQSVRESGFAQHAWSAAEATAILLTIAVATLAAWWSWRRVDSLWLPAFRSALTAVALAGAAVAVACTGSITYAQLLALLGLAVAACGATGRLVGARSGPEAAAGPILLPAAALLLLAVGYSELALWQAVVLGVAVTAAAAWLPGVHERRPRSAAAIRAAVVIVPVAVVAGLAAAALAASQRPGAEMDEIQLYSIQPPPSTRSPS